MASLHKDPRGKSKFFYCAYKGADGRRLFRTTKHTDRTKALNFCLGLERAEREGAEGRLTEARARELISDTVKRVTGQPLKFKTTREWFGEWLRGKCATNDLSKNSDVAYSHAIRLFLDSLGEIADENIAHVTSEHIQKFKLTRVSQGLSAKTLDRDLKVVRSAFKSARVFGLISFDPSQAIALLSRKGKRKSQVIAREVFTADELDDIVDAASDEWKTAILLARYTGARLGDCVRMSWEHVSFESGLIEYSDRKTGKAYKVPIHPRLEKALLALAGNDDPKGFLCPALSTKTSGGKYGLSMEFRKIMAKAGVDDRQEVTKSVKAAEGRVRHLSKRSFHSIRHSYNSELANAGTSQEVRRKLVGHSSDDMNDVYTHLDTELFRQAIKKLA